MRERGARGLCGVVAGERGMPCVCLGRDSGTFPLGFRGDDAITSSAPATKVLFPTGRGAVGRRVGAFPSTTVVKFYD